MSTRSDTEVPWVWVREIRAGRWQWTLQRNWGAAHTVLSIDTVGKRGTLALATRNAKGERVALEPSHPIARVLGVAPEAVAALEALLPTSTLHDEQGCEGDCGYCKARKKARAIIEKARGPQ